MGKSRVRNRLVQGHLVGWREDRRDGQERQGAAHHQARHEQGPVPGELGYEEQDHDQGHPCHQEAGQGRRIQQLGQPRWNPGPQAQVLLDHQRELPSLLQGDGQAEPSDHEPAGEGDHL